MNKVLIISYYWPPSGGAGVQRWLKFSKYLPSLGWTPFILTVDPKYATYPVTDESLSEDVPSAAIVYKTKATDYFTAYKKDKSKVPNAGFANNSDDSFKSKLFRFVRGNFFIPDPRKGWNRYAYKKACELIEKENIQNIITTSPPHSTQLIGLRLKRKFPAINWIADLRDPWTEIYYYDQFYPTFVSRAIDLNYEKEVLRKADRIITVGRSLKELFASKINGLEEKTEVITNGYDASDFEGINAEPPSRFTITYVGTLSDNYPVEGFVNAIKDFSETSEEFRLRFIGSVSQNHKNYITSILPDWSLEFIPYVDHAVAVRYMLSSTVLLLIIPDHSSNKSILTGKLFEYIASGKPIICLGPADGDAAEIIGESLHGRTFFYNDSKHISEYLTQLCNHNQKMEIKPAKRYSRAELTKKIIPLLKTKPENGGK